MVQVFSLSLHFDSVSELLNLHPPVKMHLIRFVFIWPSSFFRDRLIHIHAFPFRNFFWWWIGFRRFIPADNHNSILDSTYFIIWKVFLEFWIIEERCNKCFYLPHTFTSNSFLQLLPLHFNLRCWIFVSGLIRSAFFWQKGQQAYFVPLIFLINACPFHGSGGFMYSEKSIPSDSNADLMLIKNLLKFCLLYTSDAADD